jgi:hypothetical protein
MAIIGSGSNTGASLKIPSIAAAAALLLYAFNAHAEPAILKSPSVAKAGACMNKMVEDGKNAGFWTDREGGTVLILNPTRRELLPLQLSMVACFNGAFPKKEIVKNPETNVRSRVWYVLVEGYYAWCATDALKDSEDGIDKLGGHGSRRDWYGVTIVCEINDSILGFYHPR